MDRKSKYAIAVIWDLLDFLPFSIPLVDTIADIVGGFIALHLWGPAGLVSFWEVIEPTGQIDRFVPSMCISGLMSEGVFK